MWNLGCSKMVIFMGNLTINPGVLWSLLCPLPLPFQFHRTLAVGAPTCENEIWRTSIVISRKRHWATTVTHTLHDKDWTVQQMDVAKAIVKKKALSKGNKSMCHNDWPAAVGGQYPDMACFMRAWLPNQILMASSAQVDTKWHVAKVEIHQSWIVQMSPVHLGLSDIWGPKDSQGLR